jgi:hypothetical protein
MRLNGVRVVTAIKSDNVTLQKPKRASSAAFRQRDKRLDQARVGIRRQTLKDRP